MLKQRTEAASMVAGSLATAEADIERALASVAALTTTMLNARTVAKLSPVVGQEAFSRIGETATLLFQAQNRVVDAHRALNDTRGEIGLGAKALGPFQECPPMGATNHSGEVIKLVA